MDERVRTPGYREVSTQNLNPAARLVVITGRDSEQRQLAFSLNRLAILGLFVVVFAFVVAVIGALIHNMLRPGAGAKASPSAGM